MRAEIARLSPDDVGGYDGYMKASEEIFKVGFEQLGDVHSANGPTWRESRPR